ncbi:unnamed protein product [Protopolystoma xenopodis]|uniref:Myosin motor domain-containing protein n=1 Tax=Protopolystoma xenopodis TaxID=117903 RepID=A0A448X3V5_9PLAT|nr:unnamed protein product [Protopolystoma xenopodis]
MQSLFFTDDEISLVWRLLAALLHMGNILFQAVEKENIDASQIDESNDQSQEELDKTAELLKVVKFVPKV